MLSTRKATSGLQTLIRYNKISWTTGDPYNKRWQSKFNPAFYTYPRDNFEHTHVKKPEDSPTVRPPFYSYFQDVLLRVWPEAKNWYERSERYQDKFQMLVLPATSLFFFQFYELAFGFKLMTFLPLLMFYIRARDKVDQPDFQEI